MANHLRQQIRDAAKTTLTGLTTTTTHVYDSPVDELQDSQLPALRIFTNDEEINTLTLGPSRLNERSLQLVVEACVKKLATYDDQLDTIMKEVEVAIAGNNSLTATCKYVNLKKIEVEMSGDGEKPVAIGRMTFEAFYVAAIGTPDVLS